MECKFNHKDCLLILAKGKPLKPNNIDIDLSRKGKKNSDIDIATKLVHILIL